LKRILQPSCHLSSDASIRLPPRKNFSRFISLIRGNPNFTKSWLNFFYLAVRIEVVNRKSLSLSLIAGVFSFFLLPSSFGQGTAFVYQGQLGSGGTAANGGYDFQFTAYDAFTNGSIIGGPVINTNVPVSNGLFTTTIDFGAGVFTGPSRWLGIAVRTNGTGPFTPLFPFQPVQPVPYAIFANSASNLVGILSADLLAGGSTNVVALTNGANLFSGSFNGNGGAVTNVNVTNLTGVLADNQLPSNTAFLNSNQTFTANNTFNGANVFTNMLGNSFSGSFFGNGLVGWIVVTGTTVQAQIDHGYLLTNSQIVTVTLPASANVGDIVRIAGAGAAGWQLAQNAGQSVLGNFLSYGNNTWYPSSASAMNWSSMASSADGTRMAAGIWQGSSDGVYLSVNSGGTWTLSTGSKQIHGVAMSADGTEIVGAATNGFIYLSTNSGSSWITYPNSLSGDWYCVACSANGAKVVAAVFGGLIFTNTLGGAWAAPGGANQPASGNWASIASSASGNTWVAADSGTGIYTSSNGGGTWSEAFASAKTWVSVAISADGTKMAAAANGGSIYTSTNSGVNWTQQTGAPSTTWSSLASSSDGSRLVATVNGGVIYTSGNWGVTWQTNNVPVNSWSCVASSASGTSLAAGINNATTAGGIYTSQASAQTATTSTVGMTGFINGSQGSSVELQYIGNNQFMPVSYSGSIWSH
jgi:hypothetical protein